LHTHSYRADLHPFLHDALPISRRTRHAMATGLRTRTGAASDTSRQDMPMRLLPSLLTAALALGLAACTAGGDDSASADADADAEDRKSTRLNSSHVKISYAVFC